MLRSRGHVVLEFTRYSDEIRIQGTWGAIKGALATPWNPWSAHAIGQVVAEFKPDVVHVHNTFPLISPAIFHAIGPRAGRVLTLHNYRLFCPAAIPLRDGRVCTECLDTRSSLPSLRHGCYRHSRLATLPLAFSVALHLTLNTWTRQVDAFIALSDFQRQLMVQSGLPAARVYVKPNFFPSNPQPVPWADRQNYAVFAGRLTAEKGVETLIRAWTRWGGSAPELRILGDGPLRASLQWLAAAVPTAPIRFFGQVSAQEAERHIAGGKLLVLPSEGFETFGMAVLEAFVYGTPAAVSDLGLLPTLVQPGVSGVVFAPGDPDALLRAVRAAWEAPGLLERLGQGARAAFETKYTAAVNYAMLMDIYAQAIAVNQQGRNP